MNFRMIIYSIGQIFKIFAAFLIVPLIVGLIYGETQPNNLLAFLLPAMICLSIGCTCSFNRPSDTKFYAREGLLIVGFGWIVISLLGAVPFAIGTYGVAEFSDLSYVDWLFESVSGFTTTGSSILHSVEAGHQIDLLYNGGYRGLLFWRSLSHWIGGMGILVFILAVLPSVSSASGIHIMQAESTGPTVDKIVSKMRITARIMYLLYATLTLIQVLMLSIAMFFDDSMNIYHAFIISLGTAGTGGFAATSASIGSFGLYVQIVVTVFMFLFGININMYYLILTGKVLKVLKSEEVRFYTIVVLVSIIAITFNLTFTMGNALEYTSNFGTSLQYTSFAVVACITSTGFVTADFSYWPMFCQVVLMLMMFVGANSGSTGGGFKCSRVLILIKGLYVRCRKVLNPNAIYTVKIDGKKVSDEVVKGVYGYFGIYVALLFIACTVFSFDPAIAGAGDGFLSAFSASLTALNNVGPGVSHLLGPAGDFYSFSIISKLAMSLLMLLGRLEIYPILMLFAPATYKKN